MHQGGQGDAILTFGTPYQLLGNPCAQHGAPALLAKPVCGMLGPSEREENPYLTAKLGARKREAGVCPPVQG